MHETTWIGERNALQQETQEAASYLHKQGRITIPAYFHVLILILLTGVQFLFSLHYWAEMHEFILYCNLTVMQRLSPDPSNCRDPIICGISMALIS